nr:uncharacterized protein LOC109169177 [Ipomoea batatas]
MPPRRSSRSASSSSGKAPATPLLITVPFAPHQTRSATRRAIATARDAPPVPEYQQPTDILEVSSDFHGAMKYNATYVAEEGSQSSPNGSTSATGQNPFQANSATDAFSFKFYHAALDFAWEHISAKDFIGQRKFLLKDFASTPGLCDILHSAKLFQTVVRVEKFVRSVVCEFYANLVPELIRFGQAYVRGRMYAFNPMVINQFFGSFDCDADYTEDMDVVTRRLTGGTRKGYVPRAMVVLLFKIASGIQVNLGQLLFDQGFEKVASEFYEAEPKLIKADHRLLTGTHIDDLVGPNDNAGPSLAVDTTSSTVAFLENELRLIHDHRQMLSTREARITGLLSTLRQNTQDGDSPDCRATSSSDESVAF